MNQTTLKRRPFLAGLASLSTLAFASSQSQAASETDICAKFGLKLAVQQYSFIRQLKSGELPLLDYPAKVVNGTGIKAIEYFNGAMPEKENNTQFFKLLRQRCDDLDAVSTLMLCRSSHALDSSDAKIRSKSVESYKPWIEAMKTLGGEFIRVDVRSPGNYRSQLDYAEAGLNELCDYAASQQIGILVENHGNYSSNGRWLAELMRRLNRPNCGTLADFQNFHSYDFYKGVQEIMPAAHVVCAKSKAFDASGNETHVDYGRMMNIVVKSGFKGWLGIEFEGHDIEPVEGILATKKLIENVLTKMA